MENDELHRIGLLTYDEKTETWYIETGDVHRLTLSRQTLDGLLQLYNSIHTGNRLLLSDEKTLRRLEENNQRLSQTIRDLYLYADRERQNRPHRVIGRLIARLLLRPFRPR